MAQAAFPPRSDPLGDGHRFPSTAEFSRLPSQSCRSKAIQQPQLAPVARAEPLETRGKVGGASVTLRQCLEILQHRGSLIVLGRALLLGDRLDLAPRLGLSSDETAQTALALDPIAFCPFRPLGCLPLRMSAPTLARVIPGLAQQIVGRAPLPELLGLLAAGFSGQPAATDLGGHRGGVPQHPPAQQVGPLPLWQAR